jgi:carbon-monoxide dehydrogenase medium subunit
MKFENPASRYAIVGVFVARTEDGVRVGITGATHCAHRGMRLEAKLRSKFSSDACDDVEIPVEKMNADIHASAEYRAHLVKVMAKRAVAACLGSSD